MPTLPSSTAPDISLNKRISSLYAGLATLCLLTIAGKAPAALPPYHQNLKDLDVMMEFVAAHRVVAEQLRSIDLEHYAVFYGDDCKAEFKRKWVPKIPGMVGPAEPLIFARSNCDIE
jgi:hypothetical protein